MSGETLVRLVQLMEANPDAGLIQTVPRPIGGETPLARILQFSASLYGPLLASGLNYWFQDEGNYWGHNAIIRTEAFMANAGLPTLPGAPPFGGEILSHDFVGGFSAPRRMGRVAGARTRRQLRATAADAERIRQPGPALVSRVICSICGCSPSRACDRRAARIC